MCTMWHNHRVPNKGPRDQWLISTPLFSFSWKISMQHVAKIGAFNLDKDQSDSL